jgi:uncharacterized protein YdeI (YjbR/CyaY-like superfamily)
MSIIFFENAQHFRTWLAAHHQTETEIIVGFYKVGSGLPSLSWSESVDQALCFGWIDGVRRAVDANSYCIRFTPRKKNSIWSAVNIKKVEQLTEAGLMTEEGLKAFSYKNEQRSYVYSHENSLSELTPEFIQLFQSSPKAWDFFNQQAPSYKKVILHWIMSAKQDKTKLSRLEKTISASEQFQRLDARR